jgi:hypothetical protein
MGIWEKTGQDFVLKCVDLLDVKKAGFSTMPGSCSYSEGNYIGIGQAGLGKVVMNQALPGPGAGIVQFDGQKKPGETVGQKTPPFATGNSDCCHNRQYAVKIKCSNGWGWPFLLIVVLASTGYVGGHAVYSHKVQGQPLALAVPHRAFWMELKSLVEDGVALTKARALQARGGDGTYKALPDSEAPEPEPAKSTSSSSKIAAEANETGSSATGAAAAATAVEDPVSGDKGAREDDENESESDDDELVE